MRPLFLLSNDDGLGWRGLEVLTSVAREFNADVVVVAPDSHRSGASSSITINVPLRVQVVSDMPGYRVMTVNGTPADCAKLAITRLLDRQPTLLLAGINHGYNNGANTLYSGTMGVAFEGAAHHVRSIAFSYGDHSRDADMDTCRPWIKRVITHALEQPIEPDICLNVNIPMGGGCGMRVTKTDTGRWHREFTPTLDAHGNTVYWMTGEYRVADPDDHDTDIYWNDLGYVTVVPCRVDQTALDRREALAALNT